MATKAILTQKSVDQMLTAAQKKAAEKVFKDSLGSFLHQELRSVAASEARKIVKANRERIRLAVKQEFEKHLDKAVFEAIDRALKKVDIYIDN